MGVIKTKTNRVICDDPEPADAFVQVAWFGSDEHGKRKGVFHTPPQPIEEYQQAVDWAVSMADQMAHALYVVPMRYGDLMSRDRFQRAFDSMTGQERGEMRRLVVTIAANVMRDCDEVELREEAHGVLVKMGVVDQ